MSEFHLYLISDSTGETVQSVSRACLAQFDDVEPVEHLWNMVRNIRQMDMVIDDIRSNPGFVLYTLVDTDLRGRLQAACRELQVPCVSVLQPIMAAFGGYLKSEIHAQPGRQHALDSEYYARIEAMDFAMTHDDGQTTWNLGEADIIVVGVSRTSKTPTCIYLANRGIKAANIPIILGMELPRELFEVSGPMIVGLTKEPRSLVQVRRNRLRMLNEESETDYTDPETVNEEVKFARRLYSSQGWPEIDVTRRSIEETAAAIMALRAQRQEDGTT